MNDQDFIREMSDQLELSKKSIQKALGHMSRLEQLFSIIKQKEVKENGNEG